MISLKLFWERYPDAERPLRQWYKMAIHAHWSNLADVRRVYPHAASVRARSGETLTVFNIGENNYRLITRIRYDYLLVNVRAVLTHEEYDKGQWRR